MTLEAIVIMIPVTISTITSADYYVLYSSTIVQITATIDFLIILDT